MSIAERRFHHAANILVGGTGLVYGWMLYFATPAEEFSVWNHPWQGALHDFHLLSAPLLILALGMVWNHHAKACLQKGKTPRRRSGFTMLLTFLPMMFSGYLLQVTTEEVWRTTWLWVHLSSSILWIAAYCAHGFAKRTSAPAT